MSLLEKAIGGSNNPEAGSQQRSSLFSRAMAASGTEEGSSPSPPSSAPADPQHPLFEPEMVDELKGAILVLPPTQDSLLSAWSVLAAKLPLRALALFLRSGDFCSLAAQVGFPSGRSDVVPLSICPSPASGDSMGEEARALVAPILGINASMSLRSYGMESDSSNWGVWIVHDEALDAAHAQDRAVLNNLLSVILFSMHDLSLVPRARREPRALLSELSRFRFAAVHRFDIGPDYLANPTFKGLEPQALVSAFALASAQILELTGLAFPLGESSFAGVLGSATRGDLELSRVQFTKALRRSLPFLTAGAFPSGNSLSLDLASGSAAEELSNFLAI